jgi:hypothetical protein
LFEEPKGGTAFAGYAVAWQASSIIEHDQTMAGFFSQWSSPIMILHDIFK